MKEHLCIIGMNNGKPIVKRVTEEELKELNKPVETKKSNSKYDPYIRTRKAGQYYNTMYGRWQKKWERLLPNHIIHYKYYNIIPPNKESRRIVIYEISCKYYKCKSMIYTMYSV